MNTTADDSQTRAGRPEMVNRRLEAGMTLREMSADLLRRCQLKINHSQLSRYERGVATPYPRHRRQLTEYLDLPSDYFDGDLSGSEDFKELQKLTVPELKTALREAGLKLSGTKMTLVRRLFNDAPAEREN